MTRTEELLALAEAVNVPRYLPERTTEDINKLRDKWDEYRDAANPETIKQLVELAVLQHEALKWAAEVDSAYDGEPADELAEAIAAFNRFEQGGE